MILNDLPQIFEVVKLKNELNLVEFLPFCKVSIQGGPWRAYWIPCHVICGCYRQMLGARVGRAKGEPGKKSEWFF